MSTPQKIDQEIITAIINRIQAINSISGEYYYDYANVFDHHPATFTVGELPAVNLREVKEELAKELEANNAIHECGLLIDIDLIIDDPLNVNIREMKADILKSISDDLTWGGLAHTTKYISNVRDKEDSQGNKIADSTIRVKIIYRKNAWSKN